MTLWREGGREYTLSVIMTLSVHFSVYVAHQYMQCYSMHACMHAMHVSHTESDKGTSFQVFMVFMALYDSYPEDQEYVHYCYTQGFHGLIHRFSTSILCTLSQTMVFKFSWLYTLYSPV